jgi:tetratricopeptide (TPR) repeat protein
MAMQTGELKLKVLAMLAALTLSLILATPSPSFVKEQAVGEMAEELGGLIIKHGLEMIDSVGVMMQAAELEMEDKYNQAWALRSEHIKSTESSNAVLVEKIDHLLESIVKQDAAIGKRMTALVSKIRGKNKKRIARSYVSRGSCYGSAKKEDFALKNFAKALELEPKAVEGYKERGIYYMYNGQKAKAIADFEVLLKLDPNGPGGDSARMFIGV